MSKTYRNKIMKRIKSHVQVNYLIIPKEKFILGNGLWNRRCHMNAVQNVKEGKSEGVYLVCTMDSEDNVIVHFINGDSDGKYIDNTLGWAYEELDYYMIKKVDKSEYSTVDDMDNLLMDTKKDLLNVCSNGILNYIFRVDKNII